MPPPFQTAYRRLKAHFGVDPDDFRDADVVAVSDFFVEDLRRGAELTFEAILEGGPDGRIARIHSRDVTLPLVRRHADKRWVFGNLASLDKRIFKWFSSERSARYSCVEFDYRYCKHRNPSVYERIEGELCDYLATRRGARVRDFLAAAESVFFMSEAQRRVYFRDLPGIEGTATHVLSSVFDVSFFETVERLTRQSMSPSVESRQTWVVLGAKSRTKGTREAIAWCRDQGHPYEVVSGLKPSELLERLSLAQGLCFKPLSYDTCPRLVIEAKALGCELSLNEFVQHRSEPWFSGTRAELLDYLRGRPQFFWDHAFSGHRV